jgi:hypothetical protein
MVCPAGRKVALLRGIMTMLLPCIGDGDLLPRVLAEFDELPGMRLTVDQLGRLLTVDRNTCARTLQNLVRAGYLTREGSVYRRVPGRRGSCRV